ncbi:hypothetical protein [Nocardia sp. NPDC057353]|uniref:hypothetical protein n=1 Tax=Nocardia sp. NPDC057353 TaxID=3346104 RepID=UPI0036372F65
MNEKAENFLLHAISDDWTPLSEFDVILSTLQPEDYSRAFVLDAIRQFGERGWIRFGSFTGPGNAWTPWDISVQQAISRVADGYEGRVGYLHMDPVEVDRSEILRAEITEAGLERLRQLGDPYDNYGDPWADDPLSRADP